MPEPKLEQQILSHQAELQVADKLAAVENIDIDIKTDFWKMIQGHADGVALSGKGMLIQKDIRVQELHLKTDNIDINPLNAVFGQVELSHPINAVAQMVMTEADINRALNSDYIRAMMQQIELHLAGETVILKPQQIQIKLPDDSKIECSGKVQLTEAGTTRPINFIATMSPRTLRQPLKLLNFATDAGVSLEFLAAIIPKLEQLVNLPYLNLEDMALRIKDIQMQPGTLTLTADAHIRHLPHKP